MEQQTIPHHHASSSSLLLNDPRVISLHLFKAFSSKKLQQQQSYAFRKICLHSPPVLSKLNFKDRHHNCLKPSNSSEKKLLRQKSVTERHSSSIFGEETTGLSEEVKVVITEIGRVVGASQMLEIDRKCGEVVCQEASRLQKARGSKNANGKIHDNELTICCISNLLSVVRELSENSGEVHSSKEDIEPIQTQTSITLKPMNPKDQKSKISEESLVTKETMKAVDTLTTILRDHKITNIKRKLQQEAKKFSDLRKELFDGVLFSIIKAETAELSNLSQLNQVSSKLLQEQPTIEKSIGHIEKQKRIFEKMVSQAKSEEGKAAYYNLVDTALYLLKVYSMVKEIKDGGEISRVRSPPRPRKPIKDLRTSAAKTTSTIKNKLPTLDPTPNIPNFRCDTLEKDNSNSLELGELCQSIMELKEDVIRDAPLGEEERIARLKNEEEKQIVTSVYEIVSYFKGENKELRDFIATLSFEIQNNRKKEEEAKEEEPQLESEHHQIQQINDCLMGLISSVGAHNNNHKILSNSTVQESLQSLFILVQHMHQQIEENSYFKQQIRQLIKKYKLPFHTETDLLHQPPPTCLPSSQLVELTQLLEEMHFTIDSSHQSNTHLSNRLHIQLQQQRDEYQQTIQQLELDRERSHENILALEHRIHESNYSSTLTINNLKEQNLNDRHNWELEKDKLTTKEKDLLNTKTSLQSDIFILKRQVEGMKGELQKVQIYDQQEDVMRNLREENDLLRNDIIEKGKRIEEFEGDISQQRSPRAMRSGSVTGSGHSYFEEDPFKKKNASSCDLLRDIRLQSDEISRLKEEKSIIEGSLGQSKEKIGVMGLQRSRDEGIINDLRRQVKALEGELTESNNEVNRLMLEGEEVKRMESKLKERVRQYENEQGVGVMRRSQKWNNQALAGGRTDVMKSSFIHDDRQLQNKVDFMRGQLCNEKAKLIKVNEMREHDLKVLMNENQLLQMEVRDINNKLSSERMKFLISPKVLEDSMRKMEFQLTKLRQEISLLKDELKNYSNLEASYIEEFHSRALKPDFESITHKYNSNIFKSNQPSDTPRQETKPSVRLQNLERQNTSLKARIKLLSVFTIIDEQNKAFVTNTNRIINSLLSFLSTAEEFEECDYTDVDYVSTLSEYLQQEDYEGYFETLETFFKDLFLNVFERKNVAMEKQGDQLMFLKEKMEELLSEKICEIEEEEEKLSYEQRTPLKNYNSQEDKSKEALSSLQHLFKLFLKFKDPKILKEVCQVLRINEAEAPSCYERRPYNIE